jgi:hypothetical protein
MSTIDQLAPATAASDSDELPASQGGIVRKVTRAQILAGVQPQIAIGSGNLLGRVSTGTGSPESITVGANLSLTNGTLSADANQFEICSLPAGTVPGCEDLVPLGQNNENTAVTYNQFMNGLCGTSNVDASQLLVTPTGSSTSAKLRDFAANTLALAGGTLTGPLTLAGNPSAPLQAATKSYVDNGVAITLPLSGGTLSGNLTLAADPTVPLQAATKRYVDNNALPVGGGTLSGPLTLAANPVTTLQAATKQYVDNQVSSALPLGGGTLTGPLTLAANPVATLQATTKQYVDSQVSSALPLGGGALTGPLTLAADPTLSLHAATKHYVDAASGNATGVINVRTAPYNAKFDGVTDDTAAFIAAYQAAPAGSVIYVPNGVTVLRNPNNWGISITKRVKWIVDGTTLPDGTCLSNGIPGGDGPANNFLPGIVAGNSAISAEFAQTGSQPTDYAVIHSSYIVNHAGGPANAEVIANSRVDTIIYNSPNSFVWGGIDRLIWSGTQTPSGSPPTQHVGRYVQTIRNGWSADASGKPLPQPQLWSGCFEYRDTTAKPSSSTAASLTIEADWIGNGPDDANSRQILSLVLWQNNTSGAPVEISSILGAYLAAGSSGHAYRVFNIGIPFSVSVLDTTMSQQMPGAAAIRMAAGHAIAFEPTNTNRLAYDSATNTLRWNQGSLSYPVGKGITVGWQNSFTANATLANSFAGNMVFLVGNSIPYTVTLPPASSVAAGIGFTFSVTGTANVAIVPCGTDTIDNGPITLHTNDRYHIVSDGSGAWHEVFRTNAVSPQYSRPPVLPAYTIASLPMSPGAGAMAFASNGRKPNEAAGAGTGVAVYYDGARWICSWSGVQVAA